MPSTKTSCRSTAAKLRRQKQLEKQQVTQQGTSHKELNRVWDSVTVSGTQEEGEKKNHKLFVPDEDPEKKFVLFVGDSHLQTLAFHEKSFPESCLSFGFSCTPEATAKHLQRVLSEDGKKLADKKPDLLCLLAPSNIPCNTTFKNAVEIFEGLLCSAKEFCSQLGYNYQIALSQAYHRVAAIYGITYHPIGDHFCRNNRKLWNEKGTHLSDDHGLQILMDQVWTACYRMLELSPSCAPKLPFRTYSKPRRSPRRPAPVSPPVTPPETFSRGRPNRPRKSKESLCSQQSSPDTAQQNTSSLKCGNTMNSGCHVKKQRISMTQTTCSRITSESYTSSELQLDDLEIFPPLMPTAREKCDLFTPLVSLTPLSHHEPQHQPLPQEQHQTQQQQQTQQQHQTKPQLQILPQQQPQQQQQKQQQLQSLPQPQQLQEAECICPPDDPDRMSKEDATRIMTAYKQACSNELDSPGDLEALFNRLNINQDILEEAFEVLGGRTCIILKRGIAEIWINQGNWSLLSCWEANIDIQYITDGYAVAAYIATYISKSEREVGSLLGNAQREALQGNESAKDAMKTMGTIYLHNREVSAQEAAYRVTGMHLKDCSRSVDFIPTGNNIVRLTKPIKQLETSSSEDIWMKNIIDRYINRPNDSIFNDMCIAVFVSDYRILYTGQTSTRPILLQNSFGAITKRVNTPPAIIRYARFSQAQQPELFHQSILQLFLPYRAESDLKPLQYRSFEEFYNSGQILLSDNSINSVKSVVDSNRNNYDRQTDDLEAIESNVNNNANLEDAWCTLFPNQQHDRLEDIDEGLKRPDEEHAESSEIPELSITKENVQHIEKANIMTRQEGLDLVRTLNEQQMTIFNKIRKWCINKIQGKNPPPLHIFISGGAGTGKSHLIRALQYEATRLLAPLCSAPDSTSVLLAAPTGIAAYNLKTTTIHSMFSIGLDARLPYVPLGEDKLNTLRVEKVSLHPDKRPKLKTTNQPAAKKEVSNSKIKDDLARGCSTSSSPLSTPSSSAAPSRSPSSTSGLSSGFVPSPSPSQSAKAIHSLLGPSTKFRHIQGSVMHRDSHITNIRNLNLTTPGECDGFCVNFKHVAVPLSTSGGQIAIFERTNPGKQPDTNVPTIQNSANVADLCWDPFNTHRLAVAGEDAKIRVWQVPEGGLVETLTEPELILRGHTEKIYSIRFHPLASGLLVSSSYDLTVRLWSLETGEEVKILSGHEDQVFAMAWSPDGKLLATVCKDGKVRIYDPRKSATPVQEGPGPEGHRGARIVWVCEGKYLLVSGFNHQSERGLYLFSVDSLSSGAVSNVNVDVAPSTLIPFYDPDTSVVILTGKGDTRVNIYEIVPESPYFIECSSFNTPEPHKVWVGFSAQDGLQCPGVEIAVAMMLTKTTIEPVAFKVPRVKKEFFQDDVYPDTAICWEPALTASAWLSGSNGQHKKMSLKPKDMTPVSEAPKEAPVRKYMPSSYYLEEKTDEQKKEELLSAMVAKLGNLDDPLPQEAFEGVDDDEWDD
ncbi:hypothetical protein WMY93_003713 [Mugilogobius chulae]|uniref:ATP-dependent DNA helicase n=1 Tax=Mugilogobius chulae TaxID=88201 RepID=A0AAW0Q7A0_9GOBI